MAGGRKEGRKGGREESVSFFGRAKRGEANRTEAFGKKDGQRGETRQTYLQADRQEERETMKSQPYGMEHNKSQSTAKHSKASVKKKHSSQTPPPARPSRSDAIFAASPAVRACEPLRNTQRFLVATKQATLLLRRLNTPSLVRG